MLGFGGWPVSTAGPWEAPDGEVKVRPGHVAGYVRFPAMFSHTETSAEEWEGDRKREPK